MRRQYMLSFRAFVHALLEVRDEEKRNNRLLDKSVRGLCSLNKHIQVQQVQSLQSHNMIAALSQELALIREARKVGFALSSDVLR